MVPNKMLLAMALICLALSGCKKQEEASAQTPVVDATAQTETDAPEETTTTAPEAKAPASAQAEPFDMASVPVTDKPPGEWPYVSVPEGYEWDDPKTLDLSRVPFWTGDRLEFIEGKVFMSRLKASGEKNFSRFEVLKRVDDALRAQGATKITTSKVPKSVIDADLPENFGTEFYAGAAGYYGDQEVSTYLIRHADRAIWIKVFGDINDASLLVAENTAVAATP